MEHFEKKLASHLLSSDIGLVIIDEEGKIESLSDKACQLLRCEKEHLIIGSYFSPFMKDKESHNHSPTQKEINSTIVKDDDIEIEYVELIRSSSNTGKKYYIGIIKEASNEKMIDKKEIEELKHAKDEVVEQLEEEKELSELKSRFVSMASHEFRTPLAGVLSSVQLIKRYLGAETAKWNELKNKKKIETHFDKIEKSVTNLNLILNDFLSLGKMEEGKVSCVYSHFDLPKFLNNLCNELEPLCKTGQEIVYQHKSDYEEVYLDNHILRNIINNLISNSIKYSGENKPIHITSEIKEKSILITVQDSGIGIPESERRNLFKRFFRAKNAVNYQGTGLGLSIVKKYVELMNGNISFKSEENKGTTFYVFFNKHTQDEENTAN